jgi:hypothetical protein
LGAAIDPQGERSKPASLAGFVSTTGRQAVLSRRRDKPVIVRPQTDRMFCLAVGAYRSRCSMQHRILSKERPRSSGAFLRHTLYKRPYLASPRPRPLTAAPPLIPSRRTWASPARLAWAPPGAPPLFHVLCPFAVVAMRASAREPRGRCSRPSPRMAALRYPPLMRPLVVTKSRSREANR